MSNAMTEGYAAGAIPPNRGGAKTGTGSPALGIKSNVHAVITTILKIKEPRKTWGFLCDLLWKTSHIEMTERAAKHRMSGTRDYSVEEVRALLQSEDGAEILEALMADARPRWWAGVEAAMKIATARHHQEMARQVVMTLDAAPLEMPTRKKLKRVTDADRNLSAVRAKEETELGRFLFQDRDRSLAGAMASSKAQAGRAGRAGARR